VTESREAHLRRLYQRNLANLAAHFRQHNLVKVLDYLPEDAPVISVYQDALPLTVEMPRPFRCVIFTLDRYGYVLAEGFRMGHLESDTLALDPEYAAWA